MSLIDLKPEIRRACSVISQDSIKNAVSSFTSRVRAVENLKGAYLDKRKKQKLNYLTHKQKYLFKKLTCIMKWGQ